MVPQATLILHLRCSLNSVDVLLKLLLIPDGTGDIMLLIMNPAIFSQEVSHIFIFFFLRDPWWQFYVLTKPLESLILLFVTVKYSFLLTITAIHLVITIVL